MNTELQRIWSQTRKTVLFVTHSVPEAVFLSTRVMVMSPHPGRMVAEIDIDLPRPRTEETRTQPRYYDLITEVRRRLLGR
jgi:NitT/TauT family transport system ATP-binding protein